ncbi:MAG: DMT family transporter [Thermoleophilaceae bacterium]
MQTRERTWLPVFLLLSSIWGSSFLFIKVGVRDLAPLQVAFARCALGALALLAMLVVRRDRLPRGRRVWLHLFLIATLFNSVPFALFAFGETKVSSIVAGISNSTTPLWVMLVSLAILPGERPTRQRVLGLWVGFAGVLLVLGPWRDLGGELSGYAACLAAAACYGLAYPYTRRVLSDRPESGVALSAAQVLLGTLQLAPFLATTSAPDSYPLDAVLAMVALGAGGTGIAYVLNYDLIRRAGAQVASTVTYVVPLFATVLGVAVLGEELTWNLPVGAAVVLAGVALTQGRLSRPRRV